MCRSYDSGLELNGGVMHFIPAPLALGHAYVSVSVSFFFPSLFNEINRLVMEPIKPP